MNKKVFNKEVSLCQEMYKKDGGCAWGKCDACGAIPLMYKLYKGKIIDNKEELKKLKNKVLNKNNIN